MGPRRWLCPDGQPSHPHPGRLTLESGPNPTPPAPLTPHPGPGLPSPCSDPVPSSSPGAGPGPSTGTWASPKTGDRLPGALPKVRPTSAPEGACGSDASASVCPEPWGSWTPAGGCPPQGGWTPTQSSPPDAAAAAASQILSPGAPQAQCRPSVGGHRFTDGKRTPERQGNPRARGALASTCSAPRLHVRECRGWGTLLASGLRGAALLGWAWPG